MACAKEARRILGLPAFYLGKQVGHPNPQGLGQEKCFLVGDASDACFNLGQGSPGDVQADPLAFGGELVLGKAFLISKPADLFSYDVRGQEFCSIYGA